MAYDFPKTQFYRAAMTGLFVGISVTLLCLAYNYFYRGSTGFGLSDIINISSLIFFTNFLFFIIGIIYYSMLRNFKKGELFFTVLMILLTVILVWRAAYAHRTDNAIENVQFRGLLIGMVVIMGLGASFLLPYLYHNKKFEDHVV